MKLISSIYDNVFSIFCLLIAGALALLGNEGWGWFLFASVLGQITIVQEDKEENK